MLATLAFALLQVATPTTAPRIAGPQPGQLHVSALIQDTAQHRAVVYGWQEPTLIGGAVLGSLGEFVVFGFCASSDTQRNDACVLPGEVGFLFAGGFGGLAAGLIGSSNNPPTARAGYELQGDRREYGALMLGVPSLAINVLGMSWYCRQPTNLRPSGCTVGNAFSAIAVSGLNALLGYWLGKGIPGRREIR